MKKKVNGHIVDIGNMDTIEKGFEGLAVARSVSSTIKDTLSEDCEATVNKYVEAYDSVYKALPFPLYAIENDLKYAMIGEAIKDSVSEPMQIWVDNGLNVSIGEGRAIKFASGTWAVVSIKEVKSDNVSIENFRGHVGYQEFEWALKQLIEGKKLNDYYRIFMPGFVRACEDEPMVLKWELGRILEFGSIPELQEIPWNKIIDTRTKWEYSLDIYADGKKKVPGDRMVIDMTGQAPRVYEKSREDARINFDILEKRKVTIDDVDRPATLRKVTSNMDGMAALFQIVAGQASVNANGEIPKYRGIIDNGTMIFEVNGAIYKCSVGKYQKPQRVCSGYEIYTYGNGCVYLRSERKLPSGVSRCLIYAYRIQDEAQLLCKIDYK